MQEERVAELKQNVRKYLQRTSGTDKYTYEKQGADKMVTTFARKDESGQFVASSRRGSRSRGSDPVTHTRKKK